MRKSLAMIGLPILLGGCGLPPAVTAASWALDGVSYLVSGKSVTDHAISEVASQDCALFRVVQDRSICQDFVIDDGAAFVAAVSPSEAVFAPVLTPADDPLVVPAEIASFVEGFGPGIVSVAEPIDATGYAQASVRWTEEVPAENTANITAKITEDHGRFASAAPKSPPAYQVAEVVAPVVIVAAPSTPHFVSVIGSFKYRDNAERLARRHAALNAQVHVVEAEGRTWHRVVVRAPLDAVQSAGFEDAWILKQQAPGLVQMAAAN